MSQEPSKSCPASSSASPSLPTSPTIVWRRAATTSSKTRPELAAEPVEAVVAQDLPPSALRRTLVLARSDDHHDLASRHATEQPLDERCSEKARRPGHGDSPAGELVGNHRCVSSTRSPKSGRFSCGNGLRCRSDSYQSGCGGTAF